MIATDDAAPDLRVRRTRRKGSAGNAGRTLGFQIGEISVSLSSDRADVLDDFGALYDGCRSDSLLSDRTIHMRVGSAPLRLPGRARHHILGDGEALFTGRRRAELLPYLEWGINWRVIARRGEFLQLHAAVLSHNGRGVLLVGDSGVGKSTLAAGLISRGWKYLSDEFALIHPATLRVHPFPKALCVKEGSFDVVTRLGLPLWRRGHYVKAFKGPVGYVRTADLGARVATEPSPIRFVVFPRYTGSGKPRLYPVARGSAAFMLAANAFNRNVFRERTVSILSRVVREARCVRLETGDLEDTCDLIESQLLGLSAAQGGRSERRRRT